MKHHEKPSPQDCLSHYGIKGMKWGVRRYQNEDGSLTSTGKKRQKEQERQERAENARRHVLASRTVGSAKIAAASGTLALGSALVGSIATKELAQRGQIQAASTVYSMSKKVFNEAAFAAQIFAGSAIVNGMMTSKDSMKDYLAEERRIRKG